MLKSVNALALRADGLIKDYFHFTESGKLDAMTDNRVAPQPMIVVRTIYDHTKDFADRTAAIISHADFDTLDPKVQDDIRDIHEDCSIACEEINEATHHENVWSTLSDPQKQDLTQRLPSNDLHVEAIRARIKGQKRGEAAGNFFRNK